MCYIPIVILYFATQYTQTMHLFLYQYNLHFSGEALIHEWCVLHISERLPLWLSTRAQRELGTWPSKCGKYALGRLLITPQSRTIPGRFLLLTVTMSSLLGIQLKENMSMGLPTRTKNFGDYTGYAMKPCGDYEELRGSSSAPSPWLRNGEDLTKYA